MIEYLKFTKLLGYTELVNFKPLSQRQIVNPVKKAENSVQPIAKTENHISEVKPETKPSIKKDATPHATMEIKNLEIPSVENINTIEDLKNAVMNFDGCDLKKFAKNTVFSDGIPSAKIMLIGEAPGEEEDINGIPFCGKSGKLLDAILASIGIYRTKNCYITNNIFWRPPGNRAPTEEELALCKPFLEKHIALVNPDILICVGGVAAKNVLETDKSVSVLRAGKHEYKNKYLNKSINTFVIYHPAYLLRSPSKKEDAYLDILKIFSAIAV